MSTMSDWVAAVSRELGLDEPTDVDLILGVAADAAERIKRLVPPPTQQPSSLSGRGSPQPERPHLCGELAPHARVRRVLDEPPGLLALVRAHSSASPCSVTTTLGWNDVTGSSTSGTIADRSARGCHDRSTITA